MSGLDPPAPPGWLLTAGVPGWLVIVGAGGWGLLHLLPGVPTFRLRAVAAAREPRTDGGRAGRTVAALRRRIETALGRERARRRRATIELCRGLATELRTGRAPVAAFRSALAGLDPSFVGELAHVTAAAHTGADLVPALRSAATRDGAEGLGYLAACWQVTSATGAGLAAVVDRLSESLAHDEAHRQEVAAQLAGPRTTAVLLGSLPALGLAMATAVGSAPVRFLFTTPPGLMCLFAGLALDALGLWWTHRMVRRVLVTVEGG
ncbi:type II secretion system F family protein [Halostreptopolyspora alba]|uniref:Type II secretion system protein GspF domain-containing protein n=1 Tax=Halostreptopolyspora alba TaxID=2487137 RepID=A0A3N0E629_9ACTN|nr:hypothetical protein EFW17_16220 [Nocardiopsaceae bacterium YIM 96095]